MTTSTNKVAIVTGASRGIGAQIALRLGEEGFNVLVNYANSAKEADDIVEQLKGLGVDAPTAGWSDLFPPLAQLRLTLNKYRIKGHREVFWPHLFSTD